MADQTKPTLTQQAELALVQLGGQSRKQAEVSVQQLTPPEQLAAASCQREGDKMRLIDLLDHVATRQHLEADFQAFSKQESGVGNQESVEDDTDLES